MGLTVIHFSFTQNALPHYSKKVPPWQRLFAIRIAELFDDKTAKLGMPNIHDKIYLACHYIHELPGSRITADA